MFTTKYDEQKKSREHAYPNTQDSNFLGFNRDTDRWKVDISDASGAFITTIARKEVNQALNLYPLDYTTNFDKNLSLNQVFVRFEPLGVSEHIIVTFVSKSASHFNTILASGSLDKESHFFYSPDWELLLEKGDEINVKCTNDNTPVTNVNVTILGKEV